MTGPGPENPWSDGGDPSRARRLAWMWTALSVVGWVIAGFSAFSWWIAQVTGRAETQSRGYVEGDMFPWYLVVPFGLLGLYFAVVAVRKWARARTLTRGA